MLCTDRNVATCSTELMVAVVALFWAGFPPSTPAQTLDDQIPSLAEENARRYAAPVTDGLAPLLSAPAFSSAEPLGLGQVGLAVEGFGAFVPRARDRFQAVLPSSVTFRDRTFSNPYEAAGGSRSTPTVTGTGEGIVLRPREGSQFREALIQAGKDPSDFRVRFPQGFGVPALPLATLRAGVGLPAGTGVHLRWTPSVRPVDAIGSISGWGTAVRHSLTQWVAGPEPPVQMAVSYAYYDLSVGESVDARAHTVGLTADTEVGPLALFAAGNVRSADGELSYTVSNASVNPALPEGGTTITSPVASEVTPRAAAGIRFDVGPWHVAGGAATGEYPTLHLQTGLTLP